MPRYTGTLSNSQKHSPSLPLRHFSLTVHPKPTSTHFCWLAHVHLRNHQCNPCKNSLAQPVWPEFLFFLQAGSTYPLYLPSYQINFSAQEQFHQQTLQYCPEYTVAMPDSSVWPLQNKASLQTRQGNCCSCTQLQSWSYLHSSHSDAFQKCYPIHWKEP